MVVLETSVHLAQSGVGVENASLEVVAGGLVDLLFEPGVGWYERDACTDGKLQRDEIRPARVVRLGLGEETCGDFQKSAEHVALHFPKLRAVKGYSDEHTSVAEERISYPRSREGLGLTEMGLDFQFSADPIDRLNVLKILYVGAYTPAMEACQKEVGCLRSRQDPDKVLESTEPTKVSFASCAPCDEPWMKPSFSAAPPAPAAVTGFQAPRTRLPICVDLQECSGPMTWTPRPETVWEAEALGAVVPLFKANVADPRFNHSSLPYHPGGNVLPADPVVLQARFAGLTERNGAVSLDRTNVIVVGSNVPDSAFASLPVRQSLFEWVDMGGTLIVLGSGGARAWLEPHAKVHLAAHDGEPFAPNRHHRLLGSEHVLEWRNYDAPTTAWSMRDAGELFQGVLVDIDDAQFHYLSVSRPGTFGYGYVVLSAWQPSALGDVDGEPRCSDEPTESACEGAHLLLSLALTALEDFRISFGPLPPRSASAVTAVRLAAVYSPLIASWVFLEVRVTIWDASATEATAPSAGTCPDVVAIPERDAATISSSGCVNLHVEAT